MSESSDERSDCDCIETGPVASTSINGSEEQFFTVNGEQERVVKLLLTFAGGFEDCVVGELLEKIPHCHILGPFLATPLDRRDRKEIVECRKRAQPHALDAGATNKSSIEESHLAKQKDDELASCICAQSRKEAALSIAARLNGEGFLIMETIERLIPMIIEKIMTVKAVYVFITSVDISHTIGAEELKLFLSEFITSDSSFDMVQAARLWTSLYGCTSGIWQKKRKQEIETLLEDEDEKEGSNVETETSTKTNPPSSHADLENVRKRSKRVICNIPTDNMKTNQIIQSSTNTTMPLGYDFHNIQNLIEDGPTFRASVHKVHRKGYCLRRQDMAGPIGGGIQARYGWNVNLAEYNIDILAIMGNLPRVAYFGLLLSDSVSINLRHRVVCGFSSLQTYISSCLVRLADPQPGQVIYDPMCGTATIPIEGGWEYPHSFFIGSDLDKQSIAIAKKNISGASLPLEPNVDVFVADSANIPLASELVDTIISDMPWGRRCGSAKINRQFYPKFLKEWHRLVKPGGMVLVLTLERNLMKRLIEQQSSLKGLFHMENERLVDIGMEVTVMILKRL